MEIPPKEILLKPWPIHGTIWEVRFVKRMPKGGKGAQGLCDMSTHTIYIRERLSNMATFSTFIHEYLHALQSPETYRLDVSHPTIYCLEEAILELWANL